MATPTFSINGTSVDGVKAVWRRLPKRQLDTGAIEYQDFLEHTWDVGIMPMSTFLTIQLLKGQVLSSVATTDIDDLNNGATYTTAELGMVSCKHEGLFAKNVRLEFRIKP